MQVFFTDEKVLYSVSPIIRPIDDQNKKCGGRVRPTRYAPQVSGDTGTALGQDGSD